ATADASTSAPTAFTNRSPALDAIDEVQAQAGAQTLDRMLQRAAVALADVTTPNREIYLLTDLQASTMTDTLELPSAGPFPEGTRAILLPVGNRTYSNVAVTDVQVQSRIVEAGQPAQVAATLTNYGTEPIAGYVASLFLEGERVAQATADLDPDVATTVTFTVTPQRRGWLAGEVQIEDDAFEHDNRRHFTLHVPEQRQVLIVRGQEQRTDFVELALSSELTQGRVTFEVETIAEDALAATGLGNYDAVVLLGPRDLSSGEVAALTRYVDAGGGLMVFPNQGAQAPDYNALFTRLGGGTFSGFSGTFDSGRTIARFDRVDREHPLFEGVFDPSSRRGQGEVESPEVYYAMNYSPGSGTEQTLIRLTNSFPFLHEVRHGSGAAFVVAVAPDPAWSDLPVRGLFIPLLYRSIYYLSAGESVQGDRLLLGQPGEIRLTGVDEAVTLRLVGPDGEEYTPEQRTLFGATLLETDATIRTPGIYDVRAGDDVVRRVAFNLDARESDLQPRAPDVAAVDLSTSTGIPTLTLDADDRAPDEVAKTIEARRAGLELWNVFLGLALFFLVAEMLVARRWRPEPAAA
ncbi:MAG: hypothetical protein GVY18_10045, partial [Bacteroidetes bacterium]|nr:hypothetical protein [Bacteroidota bacterium]